MGEYPASYSPVIAISALSGNLTQTFAPGDRVPNLLSEEPVENGEKLCFERLDVDKLSFSYDAQAEGLRT